MNMRQSDCENESGEGGHGSENNGCWKVDEKKLAVVAKISI